MCSDNSTLYISVLFFWKFKYINQSVASLSYNLKKRKSPVLAACSPYIIWAELFPGLVSKNSFMIGQKLEVGVVSANWPTS